MSSITVNNVTRTVEVQSTGSQGPRGAVLLSGIGAPDAELGNNGDLYIDRSSGEMWTKAAGAWTDTGDNIFGTIPADAEAAKDAAEAAAVAAASSELAAGGSATSAAASAADAAASAAAALVSEENAAASAILTAADRVATAADRVATGEDRVQTGLDRIATAGDVLSTAADVIVANDAKAAAQTAELEAETAKAGTDAALASLQTLLAGSSDYSNTLAQIVGGAKEIVAAADVVAVFIYDTTRDSDGGRWRKRCRHTSWYKETLNTATRGSRREFPQKALIVARPASVTIYDLDSSNCPMWMVFPAFNSGLIPTHNGVSSVSALNGFLFVGDNRTVGSPSYGVAYIDFIKDGFWRHTNDTATGRNPGAPIVNRGSAVLYASGANTTLIVNANVNAVAATVLPGTPIDPVRKLPTPTVAVATGGGISVIHWDGRVANSGSTAVFERVAFGEGGVLFARSQNSTAVRFAPPAEFMVTGFAEHYYLFNSIPALQNSNGAGLAASGRRVFRGSSLGLDVLDHAPSSGVLVNGQNNKSAVAYVTSTFNTGHMVGDTKLALAESTADVTSLVEATPLSDDFSSYADTAALQAVWSAQATIAAHSLQGSAMRVEAAGGGSGAAYRVITGLVIGRRYRLAANISAKGGGSTNPRIYVGTQTGIPNSNDLAQYQAPSSAAPHAATVSFVATTTSAIVSINPTSTTPGAYVVVDDIRVDLVATDRSVAANHPRVVGTVTRAAVA